MIEIKQIVVIIKHNRRIDDKTLNLTDQSIVNHY